MKEHGRKRNESSGPEKEGITRAESTSGRMSAHAVARPVDDVVAATEDRATSDPSGEALYEAISPALSA